MTNNRKIWKPNKYCKCIQESVRTTDLVETVERQSLSVRGFCLTQLKAAAEISV